MVESVEVASVTPVGGLQHPEDYPERYFYYGGIVEKPR